MSLLSLVAVAYSCYSGCAGAAGSSERASKSQRRKKTTAAATAAARTAAGCRLVVHGFAAVVALVLSFHGTYIIPHTYQDTVHQHGKEKENT